MNNEKRTVLAPENDPFNAQLFIIHCSLLIA